MARQVKKKTKAKKKSDMKIADLKQIAPGVLASPGAIKDPAMKAVIDKLKKDGAGSLSRSVFQNRWKI